MPGSDVHFYPQFGMWPDGYYMTSLQLQPGRHDLPGPERVCLRSPQDARRRPVRQLHPLRPRRHSLRHAAVRHGRHDGAARQHAELLRDDGDDDQPGDVDAPLRVPRRLRHAGQFDVLRAPRKPADGRHLRHQEPDRTPRYRAAAAGRRDSPSGIDSRSLAASAGVPELRRSRVARRHPHGQRWPGLRQPRRAIKPASATTSFAAACPAACSPCPSRRPSRPDTDNRWVGSAAMDHQGNIAVGYNVSSTTTFPSLRLRRATRRRPTEWALSG